MKKTIIALLALAGVASADYTGDFSWTVGSLPTFTFDDTTDLTLIVDAVTVDGAASTTPKTNSVYANTLTPSTNVGNGGTWSISFAINNNSTEALTLKGITFDAFAYNNGGSAQNSDTYTRDITFALSGDAETSVVHSFGNVDTSGDGYADVYNWDTNPTLTFDAPVEIAAKGYASFTLTVSESDSQGCFIGLTGATLNTPAPTPAVPEPTTATLSLLALAGLAARRRRR